MTFKGENTLPAEGERVTVQPINVRRRIPQQAIEDVVQQIITKFRPQRIILFGSYATGRPRPESDVDLLVVMNTPLKETEQAVRICQAIEYHFGLDLLCGNRLTCTNASSSAIRSFAKW